MSRKPASAPTGAIAVAAPAEELCLGFANTRYWRGSDEPTEQLAAPDDLQKWLTENSAGLDPHREGKRGRSDLTRLFDDALALRESIYRVFLAVAEGKPTPANDLAVFNAALADAPQRAGVAANAKGHAWLVTPGGQSMADTLAPVIWSAADLLTHAHDRRIRRCDNDKCRWLFIDRSKGGTRRWCDMKSCGNREKAHRHYSRSKQS